MNKLLALTVELPTSNQANKYFNDVTSVVSQSDINTVLSVIFWFIYKHLWYFLILVWFILLLVFAFQLMTAQWNDKEVSKTNKFIVYSLIWIFIAIFWYSVVKLIANAF